LTRPRSNKGGKFALGTSLFSHGFGRENGQQRSHESFSHFIKKIVILNWFTLLSCRTGTEYDYCKVAKQLELTRNEVARLTAEYEANLKRKEVRKKLLKKLNTSINNTIINVSIQ